MKRLADAMAETGLELKRFDESDDARGEALSGGGIIERTVGTDLAKACQGQRRPDNFKL